MKNDDYVIRCADCPMMRMTGRAKRTNANIGKLPRGNCFCQHPDAERMFEECNTRSMRMAGFIAFTKPNSNKPNIKTTPRWCPRKRTGDDREVKKISKAKTHTKIGTARLKKIDKAEAYEITKTRKPRGLFYLQEGNGYTGIDNSTGDAWVEEFPTMTDCLKWLADRKEYINE